MAESSQEFHGIGYSEWKAVVMYVVNLHPDPAHGRWTGDVGAALWGAVRSGHGVEHIYAQPAASGAAVLFLCQPTLADAERAADDVLARCPARFTRGSVVPLTMLVELLAYESNPW
ncbi:hypothetical protein ACF1FX_06970 [Streptomyces sp. NPDC014646]|uniref:hypothetical protein n=1 Tax=unclassified Streptomyces TaxID=2593676 RepID=UPI003700E09B